MANPAGIDLADGTFWDDLGLINNTTVTVDYLWTGSVQLAKVVDTAPVLAAPAADADVVGTAAHKASVPVECTTGDWLRLGARQYLPAAAVVDIGPVATVRARGELAFPRGHTGAMDPGRTPAHVADGRVPGRRGTGAAIGSGTVAPGRALLALVVAVALVIGVNYANDYSDGIRGTDDDRVGPFRLVGSRAADADGRPRCRVRLLRRGRVGRVDARVAVAAMVADRRRRAVRGGGLVLHRRAQAVRLRRARRGGRVRVLRAGRGARHHLTQSGPPNALAVVAAIGVGMLTCAVLVANNLRDIPTDETVRASAPSPSSWATATPAGSTPRSCCCRSC